MNELNHVNFYTIRQANACVGISLGRGQSFTGAPRAQVASPYVSLLLAGVCEGSPEVFSADAALRLKLLGIST
jgi:hypothetical protein